MENTSSQERRVRERADVRGNIVKTALKIMEEEGASGLTMRRVASDMGYTAPVIYQHFANKDALVLELVEHGYRLLVAELQRPMEADIDRCFLHIAAQYVDFAGKHPHLFEAMNGTAVEAETRRNAAAPAFQVLLELLAAWSDTHDVVLTDSMEACEIIWGTLYGMVSIGRLDTIGNKRAQRLAVEALSAILKGWQN